MGRKADEEDLKRLVMRARSGDRRAYGKIFKSCHEEIFDYVARRVGNPADAEDLTMQVFAKGLKAVSGYEDRGYSVRAWLYRIAHNAVVDHFRRQRQSVELDGLPELAAETDVEAMVSEKSELAGLYGEIVGLPKAQAEVIVLRFIEDLSVSETAMVLAKKEVTVRALQFKGIKNLRARLTGAQGTDVDELGDMEAKS